MKHRIYAAIAVLAISTVLVANAVASSGGSIVAGYGGASGQANTQVSKPSTIAAPPTTRAAASAGSTLPFTGFDLGVVVIGGAGLLMLGAVLRRTGRKSR